MSATILILLLGFASASAASQNGQPKHRDSKHPAKTLSIMVGPIHLGRDNIKNLPIEPCRYCIARGGFGEKENKPTAEVPLPVPSHPNHCVEKKGEPL